MRPDASENSQISSSTIVRAPELLIAIHTSRQSCSKAGKARIFALVCGSSEESRAREGQRMKNAAEFSLLAADDGRRRDKTKRSSSLSTQGRGCLRNLGARQR